MENVRKRTLRDLFGDDEILAEELGLDLDDELVMDDIFIKLFGKHARYFYRHLTPFVDIELISSSLDTVLCIDMKGQ